MGTRVGEHDENENRKEVVLVAFEGEIANLETLLGLNAAFTRCFLRW